MNRRELIRKAVGLLGIGIAAKAVAAEDTRIWFDDDGTALPRKRSDDRRSDRNGQGYTEAELDAMPEVWFHGRVSRRWFNEQPDAWTALHKTMREFIAYAPAFLAEPLASRLSPGYKYTIHVPREWYDTLWNEADRNLSGGVDGRYGVRGLSWRGKADISPPPRSDKDEGMTKDGRIFYVSLVREDA